MAALRLSVSSPSETEEAATLSRATDNSVKWFVIRYGPWAALAVWLVYLLTGSLSADIKSIKTDLHDHINEQRFYTSSMCKMMAMTGGYPSGLCEPPSSGFTAPPVPDTHHGQ